VDLRPAFREWGLVERRQGSRGTCSAFTLAGAIEFAVAKRQGHTPRLSVEFLNWAANQACGDTADGGFFSDLWKGFSTCGICTEEDLPYQPAFDPAGRPGAGALADAKTRLPLGLRLHWIKEWNVNTGLTDEHLARIKQTLAGGWPVCGGFRWPNEARWVDGVLQMCASNAVYDGHSVLLVGYRDEPTPPGGGVFMFRNTAGDGRDGSMPYAYARAFMNDAAWVDHESRGRPEAATAGVPGTAWGFRPRTGAWFGQPRWQGDNAGDSGVGYRWHVLDPLGFTNSLKAELAHKGKRAVYAYRLPMVDYPIRSRPWSRRA
jgi:hypothetical protein